MKQIRLNVNIFFNVADDYEVTDTEGIEFKGDVELHGDNCEVLATKVAHHETIEAVDMEDFN